MYVTLSGGILLISVMSQQYNCLMELYQKTNKKYFSWKCIFLLLLYFGMLGLRWMCMHLWMNLIKRTIGIPIKLKIVKIYVQRQWIESCTLVRSHILAEFHRERATYTTLHNDHLALKWIIQICSNFYCWVCKIAFYSPNPHCCLGKLPL